MGNQTSMQQINLHSGFDCRFVDAAVHDDSMEWRQ